MPYSRGDVHANLGPQAPPTEELQPTRLLFHLGRLGPRARIGLCHLPLTVVLTVLALSVPSLWATLFHSDFVRLGIIFYVLLVASCWVIPWERLPDTAPLVIPVGDLMALGMLSYGVSTNLDGLAVLAVFPIIWLSVSGMPRWMSAAISFVAPLLIMRAAASFLPESTDVQLTGSFLLPVMLLAVSLAIRSITGNVAAQQRKLARKDKELRGLLLSSNQRERLLEAVLDAVEVGIIAVDATGTPIVANERMKRLFPPPALESRGGQHVVLYGQDRKTVLNADKHPVQRAVEGEEFGDYVVWAGEGNEQRAYSTAARSMRDGGGAFGGAVIAFSEVTGLYEAVLAKDDLVANVSHDLRSPLTSILGNLDLVLEELDSDARAPLGSVAHYLRYSQQNAERLLELVSDLLLSASAATSIHPRRTDIAGLIESCLGSLNSQARARRISLAVDVPSPLWGHVDPLRIAQVLDNLISNAIKYSPDGSEIAVTAASDGREVTVSVRDSGLGMSPQDAARAFDKFFRSEAAREAAIPGTGLGLSIAKTIVDRHGGHLHCRTALGQGTTMELLLPVDPAS
ncbi:sensor histidine kinase [Arthrobacter sp. JSM 101049]|uniref:sensor histidine kinase n=1 Tax=Arthrobacter sp. JSM 101049 TaxID=929097 RepID=UPI00356AB4DD